MSNVPYCYAVDDGYLEPVAASINSLARHWPGIELPEIHIFYPEGCCPDRQRLGALIFEPSVNENLRWTAVKVPDLQPLRRRYVTQTAFAKLCIPEALQKRFTWAFYLDADTLVFGNPASKALAHVRGSPALLACRNHPLQNFGAVYAKGGYPNAGPDPALPYFNSGVMLMNTRRLASLDLPGRALQVAQQYAEQRIGADQYLLNILLSDQWQELPDNLNLQLCCLGLRDRRVSVGTRRLTYRALRGLPGPKVIHFNGGLKPWHRKCGCLRRRLDYQRHLHGRLGAARLIKEVCLACVSSCRAALVGIWIKIMDYPRTIARFVLP